jgi:hypothetical protein
LILPLIATAVAEEAELHTRHQVAIALFPEGLQYVFEAEARFPLWKSDHILLRDAHVAIVGHAELTPSFPRAGAVLHIAPVAVWDVTLRAYGTWYFGAFSSLLPFEDPEFQATRANKRALIADGVRTGGWGTRVDVETRLKGKVGPVIAVIELQYRHHDVNSAGEDIQWFWEPTEMLNVAGTGEVINRYAYMFYEVREPVSAAPGVPADDRKLWIGAAGAWQSSPQSGDTNVRVGPIGFWKPAHGPTAPTLMIGALVWVESNFADPFPPYTFVAANWTR